MVPEKGLEIPNEASEAINAVAMRAGRWNFTASRRWKGCSGNQFDLIQFYELAHAVPNQRLHFLHLHERNLKRVMRAINNLHHSI
jgi:hypothetical protein